MKHCLLWPPSLCSAAAGWSSLLSSICGTALVSLPPWVDYTCIAICYIDLYLFLHSKTSDTGIKQFITKMLSVGISPGEISSDSSQLPPPQVCKFFSSQQQGPVPLHCGGISIGWCCLWTPLHYFKGFSSTCQVIFTNPPFTRMTLSLVYEPPPPS